MYAWFPKQQLMTDADL